MSASDPPVGEPSVPSGPPDIPIPEDFDFATDVAEPTPINTVRREHKPWHRPRKQYVRGRQWKNSFDTLVDDLQLTDEVSYLGLPGDEFLDIRYLADNASLPSEIKIRFLGFNTSEEAVSDQHEDGARAVEASAARSTTVGELSAFEETLNHPLIHRDSDLQPDDIRRVSDVNSPAHIRVSKFGPFDVVNLDLTQSIFAKNSQHGTYTDAIQHLFGLQALASRDWLFWITTRIDRQAVDRSHQVRLAKMVMDRFDECPEVRSLWTAEHFDAESPESFDLDCCTERDFASVIFMGLSLWLYGLGEAPVRQPMKVLSVFRYKVREDAVEPDMYSLVIRVSTKRPIPFDSSGLTTKPKPVVPLSKCSQFTQVVNRHHSGVDIDVLVANNNKLKQELIDETAHLLELLHMDRSAYLEWVEKYRS